MLPASAAPAPRGGPPTGPTAAHDAECAQEVAAAFGGTAVACDLSDLEAVDALELDVDVLVDDAGPQHVSPPHEFPPERFSPVLTLMLEVPFRLEPPPQPGPVGQLWPVRCHGLVMCGHRINGD